MIRRRPQVQIHQCGATVLIGLDDETAALTAVVDPWMLTPTGEVAALTDGRATYQLQRGALDRRDQWNVPGNPPTQQLPVLAEHRCDEPVPAAWQLRLNPIAKPQPKEVDF